MGTVANGCFSPVLPSPLRPTEEEAFLCRKPVGSLKSFKSHSRRNVIYCTISESGTVEENRPGAGQSGPKRKVEDYNTAMKRMMRNPYKYHHDLGMNYTIITDSLIVGSQPQKPEDIVHLKAEENVAYILCLQQDKDIEYWGIDFQSIVKTCKEVGILHMRRPAKDFDPDSLRSQLPKAVSSLEWAISEGKGRVFIHCTAGLGRAPAVAIAYMFWFCDMDMLGKEIETLWNPCHSILKKVHCDFFLLNTAYNTLTSKRPCGPNKRAIHGATYDLAKNDPWKEPFESLPEYAFGDIADWERKLIKDRVRGMRGA